MPPAPLEMRRLSRLAIAVALIVTSAAAADEPPAALSVGRLTLERCAAAAPDGWCGAIERPLDPSGAVEGVIRIGFEWYERRQADVAGAGTLVAMQGGPGYATTGTRQVFRDILSGATDDHDLLLFDARGTGTSGAIDCPAAQRAPLFDRTATADCARQLGDRAALYGTVAASDDLAALLDALEIKTVDLYGASYGTVFGQVFALKHADRLHSLVLDSALPMDASLLWRGQTGWYAALKALETVCKRADGCAAGTVQERLGRALGGLRVAPGRSPVDDAPVGPTMLFDTVIQGGYSGLVYRELDAAGDAWREGDAQPLLRLLLGGQGETATTEYDPTFASAGAFLAVSCTDFAMPFDPSAPPGERLAALRGAVTGLVDSARRSFLPFRTDEVIGSAADEGSCIDWPAPPPTIEPAYGLAAGAAYPAIPVLVLSGELDSITPPAAGALVAGRFPRAVQIVVPNATHGVTGIAPWLSPRAGDATAGCIARVVATFVRTLATGDIGCLSRRPALRVVAGFPRRLADVAPAEPTSGTPPEDDLRLAAALARTQADMVLHAWSFPAGAGVGLRGGTAQVYVTDAGYLIALKDVRWVDDLAVSGSIRLESRSGTVSGSFSLINPAGETGTMSVGWIETAQDPVAVIIGTIGPRAIYARMPTP